jgi:VanZ family protein
MLQASWLKSKAVAIGWFLLMNVLFVLPGSTLPKTGWFTDIQLDKWVHIGLFAVLVFLFCSAFNSVSKKIWIVLVAAVAYGFIVEVVQKNWVSNRSFDLYDVLADTAGSIIGLVVWLRVNKKNKPL